MAISDGIWHRVGSSRDGASRRLYLDGMVVAEDAQTSLASSYGKMIIGAGKDTGAASFFSGLIDDIRIYHGVIKP